MANEVAHYFTEKLKDFAMHVTTVVFDTALGALWLLGEFCFEHYLVPKLQISSFIPDAALWVFRVLFAVSTLVPFASQVLRHVRVEWARDRAEERLARAEIPPAQGGAQGQSK